MAKKLKKIIKSCIVLSLCVCTLVACKGSNVDSESVINEQSNSETTIETGDTEVWGAYSTVKVPQNRNDFSVYDKLAASVDISMMKNETEGSQIIITVGKDISSYELKASDLKNENGAMIKASSIEIFHQKYMKVSVDYNTLNEAYVYGDYLPDMLLPMQTAVAYGENTIKKGNNQGITIEVTTSRQTKPGVYTGEFELVMDEESVKIPVSVRVWDIEYEGKRDFQSCFLIYRDYLTYGEYSASDELVDNYTEMLLKYKINTYEIKSGYTLEEFEEEYLRYFENDNYNSIVIPVRFDTNYTLFSEDGALTKDAEQSMEYIRNLVENSTPENFYLKYAYFYPSLHDEVDARKNEVTANGDTLYEDAVKIFGDGGYYDQTLEYAVEYCKAELDGIKLVYGQDFYEEVKQAVLDIPAVITNTSAFTADIFDDLQANIYCPEINLFNTDTLAQQFIDHAEENNNGNLWTYTCLGPQYPHPTFHTDDFNLGTRVSGWMEKKNKVNGYLYWAVNVYHPLGSTSVDKFIDPYTTDERASNAVGDGYLVYPGYYYGSEYPFASLRLVNYRDAMEDYDMLSVYERLLQERSEAYGVDFHFDDYVADLYNSLFDGSIYINEDALVYQAREKLAERIVALQNGDGIVTRTVFDGNKTNLEIYSTRATIEMYGSSVPGMKKGEGYMYSIPNTSDAVKTVSFTCGENVYEYALGYNQTLALDHVTFNSAGSMFELIDDAVQLTVKSEDKGSNTANRKFNPSATFAVDGLSGMGCVSFTIENTIDTHLRAYVNLVIGTKTLSIGGVYVAPNGNKTVKIYFSSISESDLSAATGISFSFDNAESGELMADRVFRISDVVFSANA